MPTSNRFLGRLLVLTAALFCGRAALGQDAPPPPVETPQQPAEAPAPPRRPPEGSVIIDLPSADTNPPGNLQFMITHRFAEPIQDSSYHDFYSFFSPANVGLGLSYAPLRNLEAGFLRGQELEDYEVFAKYAVYAPASGPFRAAVRIGGDFRTLKGERNGSSFFAQGILAFTIGDRVRLTAVPTFSTVAIGQALPPQQNVFNLLGAVSIGITRTINVHGEVVPRTADSPGVGWIASIEKTLLRHRFSFTIGNMRGTTVDQYVIWQPPFFVGNSPHNLYFGFNIVRLWLLK
ncbi:MAG TPA: DUF5777 family beta-barrel protein [Thermoanaerobaculia bacterium]|nr:DUF5777 family beta-barrel protein [Thermoanaerobaculia bacterium]